MTIANLFSTGNQQVTTASAGTLAGTQQLTSLSYAITEAILAAIAQSEDATAAEQLQISMNDSLVLDKLINNWATLTTVDVEFLKAIDDETLDNMLKSQQSKRSRCKSKEMTMDNYKSMMTAAIAEMLIRLVTGKEKGSSGGRLGGSVSYSEERLETLAADQEALRKEIRNVQSKKSIAKSKAGFTEEDEKWQALLVAEAQLKSIRTDAPTTIKIVDTLRDELKELLSEIDQDAMTAKHLKELVATLKELVWSDVTNDEVAE